MKKYMPFLFQNIGLILTVLLVYLFLPKLLVISGPFICAFLITSFFEPIISRIERHLKNRTCISIFVILFIIVIIGGLLYLITMLGVVSINKGIVLAPEILQEIEHSFNLLFDKLENYKFMNATYLNNIKVLLSEQFISIINKISGRSIEIATVSIGYIWPVFLFIMFTLLSTYFMITQKNQIQLKIANIVGYKRYEKILQFYQENISILTNFIKAQLKISFIIYFIIICYLLVFRVKYAAIWALCITFVDLLPILGTGTVLCPLSLIYVICGDYKRAIVFISLYFITLIFRQIIQPKIMSNEIGVNAFLSLILMYAGYILKGFIGMLIAVPFYVLIKNLIKSGLFDSYYSNIKMLVSDIQTYMKN